MKIQGPINENFYPSWSILFRIFGANSRELIIKVISLLTLSFPTLSLPSLPSHGGSFLMPSPLSSIPFEFTLEDIPLQSRSPTSSIRPFLPSLASSPRRTLSPLMVESSQVLSDFPSPTQSLKNSSPFNSTQPQPSVQSQPDHEEDETSLLGSSSLRGKLGGITSDESRIPTGTVSSSVVNITNTILGAGMLAMVGFGIRLYKEIHKFFVSLSHSLSLFLPP